MSKKSHFETLAVRTRIPSSEQREHSTSVYLTSSYLFNDTEHARATFSEEIPGNIYSRFTNPNTEELINKLCLLENAEDGVACATGMAAIFSSLAGVLKTGDHIVAARALFGSTHQLLTRVMPRFGVSHSYVDIADTAAYEAAIQENTRMILVETPSNPGLQLCDLEALGQLAAARGLILNVDNTFATPWLQNPLDLGAHLVTHSATKFIDGQGRVMGGAVLGDKQLMQDIRLFNRQTGPSLSPFNAWVLSKSLETLAVRMDRHCSNALAIAEALDGCKGIANISYPFLASHPQHELAKKQMRQGGAMVCFSLEGGYPAGEKFLNQLEMISITANLGDSRTIASHPASTTHSRLSEDERLAVNIGPGMIRISAGLEHPEDIVADITQALDSL